MNGWSSMGFLGGFGMLLGTLVLIMLVALVLWGLYNLSAPDRGAHRQEQTEALDILKRRYAAGEISAAEFAQARQALDYRPPADHKAI